LYDSIFPPFKVKLNWGVHDVAMTNSAMTFDVFDLFKLVTDAYKQVFTEDNVRSAFRQTGIWPINPQLVLDKPMPKFSADVSTLLSVTEQFDKGEAMGNPAWL
jgi:hypothetical protein